MENRVYVENKDNFWRDLLVRVALIVLFIFLLIWLFPMPKLDTFYDRIFADNITMMKEAAKDYYSIERLPKEIGDKNKITLREMLDKKMILPFLDKDGNACDFDKSYVEVIRMETEYVFKINLSCNTKTDYIIDHLGCYDVCKDDECKEKETQKILEYQFSRQTSKNVIDRYTCPTDYTLKGSSCIKENSIIDKIAVKLSCPTGYNYNGVTDSCEKTVTNETDAARTCEAGYSYDNNSKMCLKYIVTDETPTPICSSGTYNTATGKCVVGNTTTYNATLVCDSGTYNASTGKCVISASSTYNASPVCSSGTYNSSTGKCVSTNDASYNATLVCSSGTYNAATGKCVSTNDASYNASLVCTQGTDNGSVCVITAATTIAAIANTTSSTTTQTIPVTESKTWSCQVYEYSYSRSNVTNATFTRTYIGKESRYTCALPSCLTTYYKYNECTAIINGSCSDSSYTYNRTARTCSKQVTTYNTTYSCASGATPTGNRCPVAAVTVSKVYTCPSGGYVSGSRCIATTTSSTNPTYSCPSGGYISGSRCIATTTSSTNPTYSCPSGGTISGDKCLVTSTTTINPGYTCPNGGTLTGSVCYVSGSSTTNPTFTCRLGTLIGNVCKITTIDRKTPTYTCNGVLSGEKCSTTSVLREQVDYICDSGYDRAGSDCIKTISSSSTIQATAIYKSVSCLEYKWSRETSLNGWIRTGKTREVIVAAKDQNVVYEK